MSYTQDNGVEVGYSSRSSERQSGEIIDQEGYTYGKSVGYRVGPGCVLETQRCPVEIPTL